MYSSHPIKPRAVLALALQMHINMYLCAHTQMGEWAGQIAHQTTFPEQLRTPGLHGLLWYAPVRETVVDSVCGYLPDGTHPLSAGTRFKSNCVNMGRVWCRWFSIKVHHALPIQPSRSSPQKGLLQKKQNEKWTVLFLQPGSTGNPSLPPPHRLLCKVYQADRLQTCWSCGVVKIPKANVGLIGKVLDAPFFLPVLGFLTPIR